MHSNKPWKLRPAKIKTEEINTALREYVRRLRISETGELEGKYHWEGNLDDLRLRELAAG